MGARYTTGRWWCWDSNQGLPHSKSSAPLYTTNSESEHQLSADAGTPLSLVPSFHSCLAIGNVALMLIDNVPLSRDPDWRFLDSQDPFLKEESHPATADQEGALQTPGGSTEGRPAQAGIKPSHCSVEPSEELVLPLPCPLTRVPCWPSGPWTAAFVVPLPAG